MDRTSCASRAICRNDLAAHHKVFDYFSCWEGTVPEGFHVNFLGVVTRASFFTMMQQHPDKRYVRSQYPAFDEEYFEWIDLLEAVNTAEGQFTMLELGAGWGRWVANAVAALRQSNNLPYTLIAVEAEPTHFQWMIQHLKDNRVDLSACQLIEAAVTGKDGKVGFYTGETPYGNPDNWYGQAVGGPTEVRAISLNTLLQPLGKVDLIDLDVEAAELEVLEAAEEQLDEKVKTVHIETHGREIESGLRSLFAALGWSCLHDYSCHSKVETEWGRIAFQGGVQTWVNPKLFDSLALADLRTRRIRTTIGFDLLLEPEDYLTKLFYHDGLFEVPETDLVTRLVRLGDTCIDAGCHVGYYTCLMAQLVGPKGHVYAFDANPWCCHRTERNLSLNGLASTDVIQAALGDRLGITSFYVSTDDQTGLSSLGAIEPHKEVIAVPCLRLDDFLRKHRLRKIRLLKLDVEGAEEIVLRGLGRFLAAHVIDFILVECFDERLRLLDSSAERVAGILQSAGYICWAYGTEHPVGWSRTAEIRSRGDCNYLFSSPSVNQAISSVSLAAALARNQVQRDQLLQQRSELQAQRDQLLSETVALKQNVKKLQDDADWLLNAVKTHEGEVARLATNKRELEAVWEAVQSSAGWRLLNKWRRVRNRLAPDNTRRRRLYDSVLRKFRARV